MDESIDSKDYFEPDEISMVSAPHEISGNGMSEL